MDNRNNRKNVKSRVKTTRIVNTNRPNNKNFKSTKSVKNSTRNNKLKKENNKAKKSAEIYSIESVKRLKTNEIKVKSNNSTNKTVNINSRRKKVKRNTVKYANIFSSIIFIFVIVYFIISFIKSSNKANLDYYTVQLGSIGSSKEVKGIIIREEKVYKANKDGFISFNVLNNEKVKKDTVIASIKNQDVIDNLEKELEQINKEILSLQENREELSWFSNDVKKINEQIQDILVEDIHYLVKNDISKFYDINDSLQKKINTRNQILLSESTGSLSELAAKRKEQEDKINSNSDIIKNSETGIVSYYIDGLEETINTENMMSLTKEQINMKTSSNLFTSSAKIQVLKDESIFKIITSNDWYIASYVDNKDTDNFEEGQNRKIYIKQNSEVKEIDAEIYHIEKSEEETFIIFKISKNILDYVDKRDITFYLDDEKFGIKIKNEAIAEENLLKIPLNFISEDGNIIKKTENGTKNLDVELFYDKDDLDFAYTPIQIGVLNIKDTILNPNDKEEYVINELLTVKGVYVINTGISKFKKIDLENSISDSEYTILDESLNSNIKIYDRIILDVKNITSEQNLYN